jgi:hypothetical protein
VLVALLVSVNGQGGAWAQMQTFAPPVESEVTYYHTDAIGSVWLLTRQDGSVAERYDYNPFGKALSDDVPAKGGNQPRGFGGKERDAATGLGATEGLSGAEFREALREALQSLRKQLLNNPGLVRGVSAP